MSASSQYAEKKGDPKGPLFNELDDPVHRCPPETYLAETSQLRNMIALFELLLTRRTCFVDADRPPRPSAEPP